MIFQIHDDHGRHIAYSPQEAKSNNENGWKNVSKEEFYDIGQAKKEVASPTEVVENTKENQDLTDDYISLFGKPPSWNMKPETIQARIDEKMAEE